MRYRQIHCKNCGASLDVDINATKCSCEFCNSVFYIDKKETVKINTYIGDILITRKLVLVTAAVLLVLVVGGVMLSLFLAGVFDQAPVEPVTPDHTFRHELAYRYEGQYLAGEDIEAGLYVAYCDPSAEKQGRIHIALTKEAGVGTDKSVKALYFTSNVYFTVESGQYVEVLRANIFKAGDLTVQKNENGALPPGYQIRVGTDIAAGEYAVKPLLPHTNQSMSVRLTKSGETSASSEQIYYRQLLTVEEGDIVSLSNCELYALADYPPGKNENGAFMPGQYKIGDEVPEGTYAFTPVSGSGRMFVGSGDPLVVTDKLLQQGTTISSQTEFALSRFDPMIFYHGEYITVYNATFKLVEG